MCIRDSCNGTLDKTEIKWQDKKSLCVVLCSKGYPENFQKNILIKDLNKLKLNKNEYCYHAGTKIDDNKIFSIGGRVLNFVCLSSDFNECRNNIHKLLELLNWKDGFFRKDIGYKVINK